MRFDTAYFEAAYGTAAQLPASDLPEIAFCGRSNVGKSSLINRIFNRKALARVSSTPGKTATVNFYNIGNARLVDLPGYGYAKVSKSEQSRWASLMDGYFSGNRNIPLVVQLIDMRHSPTALDCRMLDFLEQSGCDFIIALTKSDKLNKTETEKRLNLLGDELSFLQSIPECYPVSSIKSGGAEQLAGAIKRKFTEKGLENAE